MEALGPEIRLPAMNDEIPPVREPAPNPPASIGEG